MRLQHPAEESGVVCDRQTLVFLPNPVVPVVEHMRLQGFGVVLPVKQFLVMLAETATVLALLAVEVGLEV
tara:strand:- start:184 stop:393 length:210 start_codon:yes stop_codon:yes gene_type:complete